MCDMCGEICVCYRFVVKKFYVNLVGKYNVCPSPPFSVGRGRQGFCRVSDPVGPVGRSQRSQGERA